MKPIKNDERAFGKLFDSEEDYIKDSNLTANYNYFYDRIQKEEITVDELFDAICSLEIINIVLTEEDNPQLIFESLNSTGLDLSEGDKIRNFILMGLSSSLQEEYYEKYWNKIEECTRYDVSAYIRDYLSVKQQSIPSQNKVYLNFKDFVEMKKIETEALLKDLLDYARRYKILLQGKTSSKKLNACIYRLNRLSTTVTRPFFLEVLRLYDENILTLDQVTDIFITTETYTLEDEDVLSGRLIAKFNFKNTEQPVTSWVEMYQKVLQILYAEDKTVITKLALSEDDGLALHFSFDSTAFTKSVEIGDGINVWTNTNTQSKLSNLNKLFNLYGIDASELTFYLRDENDDNESELGTRYEVRRRYWTHALKYIHEVHGDGSFSNVNPSKENWINGFFGVSGFSICCVANYDSARVEIYFGKADKVANKKAFDELMKYKTEIEQKLGSSLYWERNDDIKASKVYCKLENVSIENEVDWLQMSKFHAEWSKKFYDVIVPYLLNH